MKMSMLSMLAAALVTSFTLIAHKVVLSHCSDWIKNFHA